jgi:DNA polymerase III delta subunit
MTQITLRGLEPEIERTIRRMAKKSGKSLNRVALDMIKKSTGSDKRPLADSLRKLAGGWSEKDAVEFLESIKSCDQIDEELWT